MGTKFRERGYSRVMEMTSCPACHTQVKITDYFCFNCGAALKAKPKSLSIGSQTLLYVGSLLLPPMGYIWGARYLKENNPKAKMVGWAAIVITTVSLILTIVTVTQMINTVNTQVTSGVMNLLGN